MASILLVDDDDQLRTMLREALTRVGYQVQEASDGQRAINLYSKHRTDLVITDLAMPEKEGIQLILELRRLNSKVKIIAMSGAGQSIIEQYLKMAKVLRAHLLPPKPFLEQELLEAVSEVLQG